jgi:putative membrane-bound dehydrogenase-like protein
MTSVHSPRALPALLLFVLGVTASSRAALPKVPEGFEVRLVATVPAVLYPCQVATAPDGALFVAEDPMDQVGPYESKNGRILLFREGKDPVPFADGFRAVQGMAWHDGKLFVSHMPFLTTLRDTNGDGKADERKDLFKDLGPTNNQGLNDHIVSGVQFGMDGFLYISVGDKGIPKATGPDGRTIQIIGGGTCRCRPDGTGLEVVSTGTRNHLEPNLDGSDNLFTYDNTDDGLGWWTRVTHHIDGGYYGYPYDYHDRPDRHLPRMAEYGGGSPCGAVLYKEDAWPEKYRGIAMWAEWGKGKVHAFRFAPAGATFKVAEAIDFAVPDEVESFRPIDLAVSYDGRTLFIADWGMGGWGSKTEKVGRIYAVTHQGEVKRRPRGKDSDRVEAQIAQLDHPSFNERMRAQSALIKKGLEALPAASAALARRETPAIARRHLVWAVDGIAGGKPEASRPLLEALKDPEADIRAQAARALGERAVPMAKDALIALAADPAPAVRLQALIALGRLKSPDSVPVLLTHLIEPDEYLAFSARQALRRIGDWKTAAAGLHSSDPKVRTATLAAMESVYDPACVSALTTFANEPNNAPDERARAVLNLGQVHRKTEPWDGRWWGTRPADGKPPAKVVAWEATASVLTAIRTRLSDPSTTVRIAAVAAAKETGDRETLPILRTRFRDEPDVSIRVAIAQALGALDDRDALPILLAAFRDRSTPDPVRDASLAAVEKIGSDLATKALIELLEHGELPVERQPRVIASLGRFKAKSAVAPLIKALKSRDAKVRAAAADALGAIGELEAAGAPIRGLLDDPVLDVRKSAIAALGTVADREAIPALLSAAERPETRFEAIKALAAMPDVLALQAYLGALGDKSPDLRKAAADAIGKVRTQAVPVLDQLAARRELSPAVVPELRKIYESLQPVTEWRVLGPFKIDNAPPFSPEGTIDLNASHTDAKGEPAVWKTAKAVDDNGQVNLAQIYSDRENLAAFGYAEITSAARRNARISVGSDDTFSVWLNGKPVYDFLDRRGFEAATDHRDITLENGPNRLLIKCGNRGGAWQFAVALTSAADYAFLKAPAAGGFNPEKYRDTARKGQGNAARGRALFEDLKGLACIKCHAVGKQGGKVGPELSSVGVKYPRDELIASVLFPSAKISSGYEPVVIATADGRVLTGIIKSDTPEAIELEDADAKRVRLTRDEIDDRKRSDVSLMPNGLAEGLTPQDFADLIAYLETLKDTPPKGESTPKPGGNGVGR